jgi:Protein of unknown function (DUF3277)
MPGVLTYDPKNVSVIIDGQIATGFADGSFVKIGRTENMWNLKVGVDGEGTRAKSNNKSGFIEITLMQSSAFNDVLSGYAAADELSNTGAVPGLVRDNNGTTLATCLTGWVVKYPDTEFAKEVTTRTWRIETDELDMFVGGN